jgi:hypothetical protein
MWNISLESVRSRNIRMNSIALALLRADSVLTAGDLNLVNVVFPDRLKAQ